jgi:hypothetical protein
MDPTADQVQKTKSDGAERSPEYAPYPSLPPDDVAPPPTYSTATTVGGGGGATTMPAEQNPYVTPAPASKSTLTDSQPLFQTKLIVLIHPKYQ